MSRRRFKPLHLATGTPVIEDGRRGPTRRRFRQLSGVGSAPKPVPVYGAIYRTMYPTAIADYNSLSTGSWTAHTFANSGFSATPSEFQPNYSGWYYRQLVLSNSIVTNLITPPIRWQCDAPATNGGAYDQLFTGSTLYSGTLKAYGWLGGGNGVKFTNFAKTGVTDWRPPESGAFACRPELLPSTSHATFTDGTMRVSDPAKSLLPLRAWDVDRGGSTYYLFTSIDALKTRGIIRPIESTISYAYFQQRINGVAVGNLSTNFEPLTGIAADDQYSVDIWYRITTKPFGASSIDNLKEFTLAMPELRTLPVPSGGRRIHWQGTAISRWLAFSGCDMSSNWDKNFYTYQITLNGHSGWTLKDGSNGPHKIKSQGQWVASIGDSSVTWDVPAGGASASGWIRRIELLWDREIPIVKLYFSQSMITAGVEDPGTAGLRYLLYRPASGTEYRTSTASATYAKTLQHGPSGVFSQSGTTTFNLVEWSVLKQHPYIAVEQFRTFNVNARTFDGWVTSVLPVIPEVPTSITITRVAR